MQLNVISKPASSNNSVERSERSVFHVEPEVITLKKDPSEELTSINGYRLKKDSNIAFENKSLFSIETLTD